jgi:hypothetical protein
VAAEAYKLASWPKRIFYHRGEKKRDVNPIMEMEIIVGKKFHVTYTMEV